MKKVIISIILVLTILVSCSKESGESEEKTGEKETYEFNYAVFFPATHLQAQTAEA